MALRRRVRGAPIGARRGLTLIELMVTLVILSIGLVGVSSMFIVAFKNQRHAHYASVASDLASRRLEQMRAAGYNSISTAIFPGVEVVPEIPAGEISTQWEPYPDSTSANQYRCTVLVSWGGGPGISGTVSQVTIISNHG